MSNSTGKEEQKQGLVGAQTADDPVAVNAVAGVEPSGQALWIRWGYGGRTGRVRKGVRPGIGLV